MKHQEELNSDSNETNTRYKNTNHSPSASNMSRKKDDATNPSNFSVTLAGPTFIGPGLSYDGQNSHPQPLHPQSQMSSQSQPIDRGYGMPFAGYDVNNYAEFPSNSQMLVDQNQVHSQLTSPQYMFNSPHPHSMNIPHYSGMSSIPSQRPLVFPMVPGTSSTTQTIMDKRPAPHTDEGPSLKKPRMGINPYPAPPTPQFMPGTPGGYVPQVSQPQASIPTNHEPSEEKEKSSKKQRQNKKRFVWSPDRHQQFLAAVNTLGIENAAPKTILRLMKVDGLTTEHVKSHLQKYRISLRKDKGEDNIKLSPTSSPNTPNMTTQQHANVPSTAGHHNKEVVSQETLQQQIQIQKMTMQLQVQVQVQLQQQLLLQQQIQKQIEQLVNFNNDDKITPTEKNLKNSTQETSLQLRMQLQMQLHRNLLVQKELQQQLDQTLKYIQNPTSSNSGSNIKDETVSNNDDDDDDYSETDSPLVDTSGDTNLYKNEQNNHTPTAKKPTIDIKS